MQNDLAGFPDGFASLHNGCACLPNDFARLNNGCASLPNDLAMMQDDFASLPNRLAGMRNDFANWRRGLVIKRSLDGACGIQVNGVKNHPASLLACDSKECLWLRSFLDFVALHPGFYEHPVVKRLYPVFFCCSNPITQSLKFNCLMRLRVLTRRSHSPSIRAELEFAPYTSIHTHGFRNPS
ncbi:MAG: hypothetical protein PHE55_20000 [Methylococcaceae bacterium]|nr:hypothetical protein [Methylococcaceae bacterium]